MGVMCGGYVRGLRGGTGNGYIHLVPDLTAYGSFGIINIPDRVRARYGREAPLIWETDMGLIFICVVLLAPTFITTVCTANRDITKGRY